MIAFQEALSPAGYVSGILMNSGTVLSSSSNGIWIDGGERQ